MAPKVLIIGGGVGGLALAHGLKNRNIPFHVYEKDRTQDYRAQGYRFRLSPPGIDALEALLTPEVFKDFELSCADLRANSIPEIDAETAKVVPPSVEAIPIPPGMRAQCVDRTSFRAVLIRHLDKQYISYGKQFERYETTSEGVTAHFTDGTSATGTLLVAADGAYSRVRKQLLPDPSFDPSETGSACVYGKTPLTQAFIDKVVPAATQSMSVVKDRKKHEIRIMGMDPLRFLGRDELKSRSDVDLPKDYLFWVLGMASEDGFPGEKASGLSPEESERRALEWSEHWDPSIRAIIEHQEKGETAAFSITALKPGWKSWEATERVTGLGDAMHKLTPTGAGALLALRDARALADLLAEKSQSKEVIQEYEDGMREAAGKEIDMSWRVGKMSQQTRDNEKHMGDMMMSIRQSRQKAS